MRSYLIAASILALAGPVAAQNAPSYLNTAGQRASSQGVVCVTPAGVLESCAGTGASGTSSRTVQGAGPASAAAVANPVGIGGVAAVTMVPTYSTQGFRTDLWTDSAGNLRVLPRLNPTAASDGFANASVNFFGPTNSHTGASSLAVAGQVFNGTTWDRMRTVQGSDGTGLGIQAVAMAPVSTSGGALAATVTSAVASSVVGKASAGNMYDWQVTTGAIAGYVMTFNATSAPADGAVTPTQCVAVAANTTVGSSMLSMPERYSTGAVIVFSTTGCFIKTASATAFIRVRVQ